MNVLKRLTSAVAPVLAAICLSLPGAAAAQADVLSVDAPWVRATVPQQRSTGAFMALTARADARLVAAESPVARVVEVHEMALQDNVMRMRQVPAIALPAGQAVALEPGGYHLMLIDLHRQVKEGETVDLTLHLEWADGRRSQVAVQAPVRPLTARAAGHGGHGGAAHAH